MKTPVALIRIACWALAMAWLSDGRAQLQTNRPLTSAADATPAPPPAELSSRALTSPLELPSPAVIALTNDAPPRNQRPPSRIRLSPWATEIVKLAEARIGDDVLYSFIENSGTFNLGADQIVYLSDLGLSSEIISAMLQHDQELISGVRPLTVASEPAWEPVLPLPISASTDGSARSSSQPAPVSVPPVPAVAVPPAAADVKPPPEINRGIPEVQLAALPVAKTEEFVSANLPVLLAKRQTAARKKSLYPVREPQPVELTAPIIFIEGEDRPPNTIIIVGFPRTEPPLPDK